METLKQQLAKMQEQLGQLSASQKMLVASLVAVMVLTLLFYSRYAGTADMEAVLDQPMKTEEIAPITARIAAKGIEYKVVGDRVMVPSDRKLDVLADLSYLKLVPSDTRSAYDEIIKRINPWSSQSDNDATRNEAKAMLLGQIIKQFPGVHSADVIIDPTTSRTIGGGGTQPTASILIVTDDPSNKRNDRTLVDAAANAAHGAQSGLDLKNITVVVNGVRYNVNDRDPMNGGGNDEMLSHQQEAEQAYAQKISQQLSFAGAVLVSVTCDVNIKYEKRHEETYDPKNAVQKESETTSDTTDENSAGAQPSGEPGAQANASIQVGGSSGTSGGGGGGGSNHEKTVTKYDNHVGVTEIDSNTPAGKAKVVGVAVRVPRSYFVVVYKGRNPGLSSKEPDDAALQPIMTAELATMKNEVKKCTYVTNDDDVAVEAYTDTLPMLAATSTIAMAGSSSSAFTGAIGGHYKEIVIGALALVSLFMISSIVKKTTPAPVVATSIELKEAPALSSGEDIAGDVGEGTSTLDGMELDDDTVKAQQMVEQVETMVKENPDAAANLVKRWLNRS